MEKPISYEDYRQWVSDTALHAPGLTYPVKTLVCEAAEIQGLLLKIERKTRSMTVLVEEIEPEMLRAIKVEVSDAFWALTNIMNQLGLSFEDLAAINYEKLVSRQHVMGHFVNTSHLSSDAVENQKRNP